MKKMTTEDGYELEPLSQNYRHCVDVYRLMAKEAKTHTGDSGVTMVVWEGFFTKLIVERMNLSVPYYSTIRKELMRMGCVKQLRRGGGSSPSQWELMHPPTEDLYRNAPAKKVRTGPQEAVEGQLRDLHRRLSRMEENFDTLMDVLNAAKIQVPFDEPNVPKQYEVIAE